MAKKICYEHNTWNRRRNYRAFKWLDKFIYGKFDAVVGITDDVCDELQKWLGGPIKNIKTIENGISIGEFKPQKKSLGSTITLGMVGRIAEQKDINTLINLISNSAEHINFKYAGDGMKLEYYRSLVRQKGIDHRFEFVGAITDIENFMASIDVYVHSAFWEGFGIAVIEAMSCGVPVIYSNTKGVSEIVAEFGVPYTQGSDTDAVRALTVVLEHYQTYSNLALRRSKLYDVRTSQIKIQKLAMNINTIG